VRPHLQTIPGIAEILSMGGGIKRLEVQPDPWRMQAAGVTFEELRRAAADAASTTTGGFLDAGSSEIMVRNLAMTVRPEDIAGTVIKTVNDLPVAIGDVARVDWDIEPMRGDAAISVRPETEATPAVIMSVTKTPGFDTRKLTEQIESALDGLAAS